MKKLSVTTNTKDYNILITNTFNQLAEELLTLGLTNRKMCIITDDNVNKYYSEELYTIIDKLALKTITHVFEHGEKNKNLNTVNNLYKKLINEQFDRDSVLIALGGGVTGDLVGFTAATYMRGIKFIQIPTSLLAQVDSSVGGKTGVDFDGYKNIVGAFYQPELVYINTSTLKTLPKREFNSGMAEVIKHGIIKNNKYFEFFVNEASAIKNLNENKLETLIYESCKIKSSVVSQDEKELGIRAILNYGHTIGHAIERLLEFKLLHGECVSVGSVAAAHLSRLLGTLSTNEFERIIECFEAYDLPINIDNLNTQTIFKELFYDKKTKNNTVNFIISDGIGNCIIKNDISENNILAAIDYILNRRNS